MQSAALGIGRCVSVVCNSTYALQNQALGARREVKAQFEQLHQVLHREEQQRMAAVRREEEQKIAGMRDKISQISEEMLSLEESFRVLESELNADDMTLLQVCLLFTTTQQQQQHYM